MNCGNCGEPVKGGVGFCSNCGWKVPEEVVFAAPQEGVPFENNTPPPAEQTGGWVQPGQQSGQVGGAAAQDYPWQQPQNQAQWQPAEPAAQPPYSNAAPVYNGYGQPAAPPPKPKKKKKLLVALAVVLVVAVLAAVFTPLIVKAANPWGHVWKSAGKTIAGIADELDKEKGIMQAGAVIQQVYEGKTQQDLEVVLESVPGIPLQDVGVTASIALDVPGEEMSGQYGVLMAGVPFVEASVEIAENVVTAEVPKLFKGTYGVDIATIGEDFNRSAFAGLTGGYLEEDFSYSAFELFMGFAKNPGEMVSPEGIIKLTELGVALTKEMLVTRGSNTVVSVNTFEIKCEVYNITIPKAALEKFLLGVADVLEQDEGYQAYMEKSMAGSYLMAATLSADVPSLSEMAAEQIELTGERLAELAYAFEADVEAVVSIAKNRVRKVEAATRMFVADEERDVQLTLEVGGEKELTSDFYAEWDYSDYETSSLTFHREQQDGMYQYNVLMTNNGYTYDLDLAYEPDGTGDNFNLLAIVNDGYEDVQFEILGNVAIDAAKGTLQADFNYIAVSFGSGGDTYELHASYLVVPIDEVELQNGEPTMLLDMSEAELEAFAEEIQMNAEAILYEIVSVFS